MAEDRQFNADEAKRIGEQIGITWNAVDLDQFRKGLAVEMEHGSHDPQTDVTHDDPLLTGKIAWAHIKEYPDYYTRLETMETEAEQYWATHTRPGR
ncbi:MAG: hypothetical protein M3Y58_12215 [Chloroflexota bacterium]|nr:hypothetical protein [Chloroflexota bacterium]